MRTARNYLDLYAFLAVAKGLCLRRLNLGCDLKATGVKQAAANRHSLTLSRYDRHRRVGGGKPPVYHIAD